MREVVRCDRSASRFIAAWNCSFAIPSPGGRPVELRFVRFCYVRATLTRRPTPEEYFSAWDYAKRRCEAMAVAS